MVISHFTAQSGAYVHGREPASPTQFISLWIVLFQHEQVKCAHVVTLFRLFNTFFISVYKMNDGRKRKEKEEMKNEKLCVNTRELFLNLKCVFPSPDQCAVLFQCYVHAARNKLNSVIPQVHTIEDFMSFLNSAKCI